MLFLISLLSANAFTYFISGGVLGALAFWVIRKILAGSSSAPPMDTSGVTPLDKNTADNKRQEYRNKYPQKVHGINVSFEEWRLINKTILDLGADFSNYAGVRLHFIENAPLHLRTKSAAFSLGVTGDDSESVVTALSYPIPAEDEMSADYSMDEVNSVELSSKQFTDPCPPWCD